MLTYIEFIQFVVDWKFVSSDGSFPGKKPSSLLNVGVGPDREVGGDGGEADDAGRRQSDRSEAKFFRAKN